MLSSQFPSPAKSFILPAQHTNQRVADKNFNPIEGLYASGNNSGGRFGTHYSTPIQGVSLGMALTLGRVLGKELSGQEISK